MEDLTLASIAKYAATMRTEDAPAEVCARARDTFVDTLACAIGGRMCEAARVARAYAGEGRGIVIGGKQGTAPDVAAFCNTGMTRYLDYNDTLVIGHPSDMIGAMIAEANERALTGADMLLAIVVAYEVFGKVSQRVKEITESDLSGVDALTIDQGYAACVGAAAGLCNLLRLPLDQTTHAISFAAANGVPLRASRSGELSNYKGLATAVSTRHAVFCVRLARAGITAPSAPFDGRHGITELLTGKAGPMELPKLGASELTQSCLKYFPLTQNSQPAAWAALVARKRLDPAHVAAITLYTSKFLKHESGSEPAKWRPQKRETADHSVPYIFCRALQDGAIDVGSFAPDKFRDPSTLALMDRMKVEIDDAIEAEWPDVLQVRADITLQDGSRREIRVRDPRGTPRNPMTKDDIQQKFLKLATPALGADAAQAAFDCAWEIETAEAVLPILTSLAVN